jgi:lambda family phage portal protein
MALGGAWAGTRKDRNQPRTWANGIAGSADEDLLDDLPALRRRSRQLVRDNPLAGGALNVAVKHVVGTGLSMRSQLDREILGWDEERASAWQERTNRLFDMWCRSKASDVTLHQDFWELQDLAFRTTLESGDALAIFAFRKHPSSHWGTCIQLVEGDRLCNKDNAQDTKTLAGGVVLDGDGLAEVGYHIRDQHPGARLGTQGKATWTIRNALTPSGRRLVQHLYMKLRPDQHRGVPYLAPVIESLKDLGDYTDGELRAAVVSGLYTVGIKSPAARDDFGNPIPLADEQENDKADELELGYGAILRLDAGEEFDTTTPGRPNAAFDPFVMAVYRQIGTFLEIPYPVLIQHFTENYNAIRGSLLELMKFVKRRRAWLVSNFCQPAYEAWLEEAVAQGDIQAPGFFDQPLLRMAFCGALWVGDAMGHVDLLKEVNAWKTASQETFTTKDEATSALFGGDYGRNVEIRGREIKKEVAAGIPQPPPPGAPGQGFPPAPQPEPSQDPKPAQDGAKPKKENP